jgi:hypothetical protein
MDDESLARRAGLIAPKRCETLFLYKKKALSVSRQRFVLWTYLRLIPFTQGETPVSDEIVYPDGYGPDPGGTCLRDPVNGIWFSAPLNGLVQDNHSF